MFYEIEGEKGRDCVPLRWGRASARLGSLAHTRHIILHDREPRSTRNKEIGFSPEQLVFSPEKMYSNG